MGQKRNVQKVFCGLVGFEPSRVRCTEYRSITLKWSSPVSDRTPDLKKVLVVCAWKSYKHQTQRSDSDLQSTHNSESQFAIGPQDYSKPALFCFQGKREVMHRGCQVCGSPWYFNLSVGVQSPPVSSNVILRRCVMFKIVYPICCRIDIQKGFILAFIATTNDCGITTYKSKRFSTFTYNLRQCAVWFLQYKACRHVGERGFTWLFGRIAL